MKEGVLHHFPFLVNFVVITRCAQAKRHGFLQPVFFWYNHIEATTGGENPALGYALSPESFLHDGIEAMPRLP